MRSLIGFGVTSLAAVCLLSACGKPNDPVATPDAPAPAADAPAAAAATTWPASVPAFGDGFPNPGDACRRVGESEATVNYLDDSASLVGCLSADDAAKLGGAVVATLDGVTLVSVPTPAAVPGDGDSQGDATVAGTDYSATAQVRCSGYPDEAPGGLCEAGVKRGTETGTQVDVTLPNGVIRTVFFNSDGSFLSFATAQADGTAAMAISSSREGDTTIAMLGNERYEIPDAFVKGD